MIPHTFWPLFEGDIDVTLVLVTLASLLLFYVLYARFAGRDSWEKYGIKHCTMGFDIMQSLDSLLDNGVDTVGVYAGKMILISRDLRLLKEIMVKQFNSFPDRTDIVRTRSYLGRGLAFLRGGKWKRMRHVMSPSFSTSKMKQMSFYVHSSAQKLASVFEACAREERLIEVKHTLGQYTSGIIAKTGFGLTTDCLGEQDNEFTRHCKNLMKSRAAKGLARLLQTVAFRLPALNKFLIEIIGVDTLDGVDRESDKYFNEILRMSIDERKQIEKTDKRKPADFLQNLIAAQVATDQTKASKGISQADVIGQSLLILFAAFETTSSTLQYCFLLLAMHPDIQEKVYKEIMEVVSLSDDVIEEEDGGGGGSDTTWGPTPSLDQLQRLSYTQQVIDETLRMYPPGPVITRQANYTTTLNLSSVGGDTTRAGHHTCRGPELETDSDLVRKRPGQTASAGEDTPRKTAGTAEIITIPAGATIFIPIAKIHKDPRHYPDPEKFDPDRFLPKNKAARHPLSFMPFGFGPRQCIGMRMAYLEVKTALVYVLRRVRLEVNDLTEPQAGESISVSVGRGLTVNPLKPIQLASRLR